MNFEIFCPTNRNRVYYISKYLNSAKSKIVLVLFVLEINELKNLKKSSELIHTPNTFISKIIT